MVCIDDPWFVQAIIPWIVQYGTINGLSKYALVHNISIRVFTVDFHTG